MKRFLVTTLLLLVIPAQVAFANSEAERTPPSQTPNNIAFAAYRGQIDGIPGYSLLANAYLFRDIKAEDVVRAAVAQGRLPESALEDRGFIQAVDNSLRPLLCSTCN